MHIILKYLKILTLEGSYVAFGSKTDSILVNKPTIHVLKKTEPATSQDFLVLPGNTFSSTACVPKHLTNRLLNFKILIPFSFFFCI